jgi:hypothetical protein
MSLFLNLAPSRTLITGNPCRSHETVCFRWKEQSNEIFSSDFFMKGLLEDPVSGNFFELGFESVKELVNFFLNYLLCIRLFMLTIMCT